MSSCPQCGAALQPGTAEGLCPRCLLAAGLAETEARAPAWTPPTVASLSALSEDLEVVRLLGRGGMGAVYEARQRKLDRRVALKVLPPELGEEPGFAERLEREARALAKLSHQNIVGIHDFGKAGSLPYVVMEYVDGRSLRQLLQAGPVEPGRAVQIALQICEGLQYAHDRGVIHRDIKPENILIDAAGRVRIADFGLAKLIAETQASTLTGPHDVMGTVHYMAPEQMERPAEIDHRADLYALGVVFYEMLTGQLPIGRFPPPSQRTNTLTHLDEVVLKLLEHDPGKRHESALQVMQDVERAAPRGTPSPGAAPVPPQAPRDDARRLCLWILIAGSLGFVAMFLPWMTVSSSTLNDWRYGKGRDAFGDKSSPDHPFNSPFFKEHRTPEREFLASFRAWESDLYQIPNGIPDIVSAVLALMAAVTLGSSWRAPWRAYGIPAGYGLLHSLLFMILIVREGASPAIGSMVTLGAFVTIAIAAWLMRPAPAKRTYPTAEVRARRRRRRTSPGR